MVNLSLSNVINVTILGTPQGLNVPNINTVALFTDETPLTTFDDSYKIYMEPSSVESDFGSSSETFAQATAFFSQIPNPTSTSGYLTIIPLLSDLAVKASKQIQDLIYEAKTAGTGGNSITIAYTTGGTKGSEVVTVATNAISVQIETGVSTASSIATAIQNSTSASALVNVYIANGKSTSTQTAPVTATNLTNGAASGGDEKIIDAIARTINDVYYFGITTTTVIADIDLAPLCSYVTSVDKMLFLSSATSADLNSNGKFDLIRQASLKNIRCLYYSVTAKDARVYASAYASRGLSTSFTGSNTTTTMNLKSLTGITVDPSIDQTSLNKAKACGADVYCSISGVPCIMTSGENAFFDEVYNQYALKFYIETESFNYLRLTNTKIPQTEQGVQGIKNAISKVLEQFKNNGYLGVGLTWTSSTTFGDPEDLARNITDTGYYIYSLPVASQLPADRTARKAPLIQVACKSAGAIHKADIIVNINL